MTRKIAAPTREQIAEAAYLRYLNRGGQHGSDFDDWIAAERELTARFAAIASETSETTAPAAAMTARRARPRATAADASTARPARPRAPRKPRS